MSVGESPLSLQFERDNPCNTTIVDHDGNTFYTVATDFADPKKPVTRVHDGIGKLVAEWVWRDARSDLLTIRDLPQAPASAWLKKSVIPFRDDVTFRDDAGVEYVWKDNKPGLGLQLFGPRSKTQPVARFHPHVQGLQCRPREPARRALDAPARRKRGAHSRPYRHLFSPLGTTAAARLKRPPSIAPKLTRSVASCKTCPVI
ncbi:hypothetical protein F5148DRAFT_353558 [Russula earlei]|uniref:Uncharacterized protein n=1 Tax=Russula earlei TaxID=71964 RepID=A0ACC0U1Y6_9AGAM|nr:hypothetical protein F5148DRAFT_353558 [Russula earlei]